jgi:hypothetical protein
MNFKYLQYWICAIMTGMMCLKAENGAHVFDLHKSLDEGGAGQRNNWTASWLTFSVLNIKQDLLHDLPLVRVRTREYCSGRNVNYYSKFIVPKKVRNRRIVSSDIHPNISLFSYSDNSKKISQFQCSDGLQQECYDGLSLSS